MRDYFPPWSKEDRKYRKGRAVVKEMEIKADKSSWGEVA